MTIESNNRDRPPLPRAEMIREFNAARDKRRRLPEQPAPPTAETTPTTIAAAAIATDLIRMDSDKG